MTTDPQPSYQLLTQLPSDAQMVMQDDESNVAMANGQPDSLSALMIIENGFSVSVLKKRRRLIDLLRTKRAQEIVIHPH